MCIHSSICSNLISVVSADHDGIILGPGEKVCCAYFVFLSLLCLTLFKILLGLLLFIYCLVLLKTKMMLSVADSGLERKARIATFQISLFERGMSKLISCGSLHFLFHIVSCSFQICESFLQASSMMQVLDVITASTNDMGPLSLDTFRRNNLSASWKVGVDTKVVATFEVKMSTILLFGFLLMFVPVKSVM